MCRSTMLAAAIVAAAAQCDTWYETTKHGQGFRNVKDAQWGAKGDGITDDTASLVRALTAGRNSGFTTHDPAVVYLPPGTYLVSGTLVLYFYTHLVGNYKCPPTLLLANNTWGNGQQFVISADQSYNGDHDNEFYRAVTNIKIDMGYGNNGGCGLHWAVSQATHIRNVTVDMTNGGKFGIFMENGSGGFLSDFTVLGGQVGMDIGNQQWTYRDVTVTGAQQQCINVFWTWTFAFLGLNVGTCPVAIQFNDPSDGTLLLLDSTISNVGVGVNTTYPNKPGNGDLPNLYFEGLTAVDVPTVTPGLPGNGVGSMSIPAWRQGPYLAAGAVQNGIQGAVPVTRTAPLERRARPTFDGWTVYNAFDYGAKGDGVTDDTAAVKAALAAATTPNSLVFLPQGAYLISSPLTMQPGTALVGEVMSILLAAGGAAPWNDASNPQALLSTPSGAPAWIVDVLFSADGDVPGCIFLDWTSTSAGGVWDSHWRLLNTAHTLFYVHDPTPGTAAGGYFENMWGWVADHDIDSGAQLNVTNPYGFHVTSTGQTWWYGTAAEHSYVSQYNFTGASNVVTLVTQTESPYWQVPPTALAMKMSGVSNVQMYGSGFYNWFNGNQSTVFSVDGGAANVNLNTFGINVHGVETVVVTDTQGTVQAYTPVEEEWFCDGYTVYTGVA